MTWTVYALLDEVGAVRYVGVTRLDLDVRLAGHLSESQAGGKNGKCQWIREMAANGSRPSIVDLESGLQSEEEADASEKKWIAHARSAGWPIVNERPGGGGTRCGRPVTTERGQESRTRVTVSLSPDEARALERAAGGAGQTGAATTGRAEGMAANPMCACGCGAQIERFDEWGRPRSFVSGHNSSKRSA